MNDENKDDIEEQINRLKRVSDSEAARLRRPEFEDPNGPAIARILREAGLPKRHLGGDINRSGAWGEVHDTLATRRGTGFLCALIGPRGVGKTQMAVSLASLAVRAGGRVHFATATRFLMEIKETYRKDAPKTERQVVREFATPGLLIIDELGRRGETDWEDRLLFELLNDRYNAMVDTIAISNHATVSEFSKAVGDSLVSRIDETGGVIVCNWPSFRK